jgi:4-hydroxy-tetrahydrodipicolinate synthase
VGLPAVLAPVPTPFGRDLRPDPAAFVAFCRRLQGQDIGLAPFGTTGEGNSLSVDEKLALLDALAAAGLDLGRVMPGTGMCALSDTVRLTAHAVRLGCGGALVLPPFYYKEVSDDGLFRAYAEVIERVGDVRLRMYLYHFPSQSRTPLSPALVERLLARYPGTIAGLKDSGGELANMEALCRACPGLAVFTGSESLLLALLAAGGRGCISSNANFNGRAMARLCRSWRDADAAAQQAELDRFRRVLQGYPLIPALKALAARAEARPDWRLTRPPLLDLPPELEPPLLARLEAEGFAGLLGGTG